ncbi:MAG: hypothetical protein WCO94_13490, partial [Verrucomicrobiota bacterium]
KGVKKPLPTAGSKKNLRISEERDAAPKIVIGDGWPGSMGLPSDNIRSLSRSKRTLVWGARAQRESLSQSRRDDLF